MFKIVPHVMPDESRGLQLVDPKFTPQKISESFLRHLYRVFSVSGAAFQYLNKCIQLACQRILMDEQ